MSHDMVAMAGHFSGMLLDIKVIIVIISFHLNSLLLKNINMKNC